MGSYDTNYTGVLLKHVKIRIKILNALKRIPMSAYEISIYQKIDLRSVQNQLFYLNELGKVEKYYVDSLGKELWRLKKKRWFYGNDFEKEEKDIQSNKKIDNQMFEGIS